MSRYDLTDFEWRVIEALLPNNPRVDDRRVFGPVMGWRGWTINSSGFDFHNSSMAAQDFLNSSALSCLTEVERRRLHCP